MSSHGFGLHSGASLKGQLKGDHPFQSLHDLHMNHVQVPKNPGTPKSDPSALAAEAITLGVGLWISRFGICWVCWFSHSTLMCLIPWTATVCLPEFLTWAVTNSRPGTVRTWTPCYLAAKPCFETTCNSGLRKIFLTCPTVFPSKWAVLELHDSMP